MSTTAVVTMVRDDAFFLKAWLRHYGTLFGRENCYIINHGRGKEVAALAEGCNLIGIPGEPHKNFDVKRWGLLNAVVGGLRRYYAHVIVGDVDELLVLDPATGQTLPSFLDAARKGRILTPLGLEVVHRVDVEDAHIEGRILGPRRYVRHAAHYSKPCVIGAPTKIARGGHFTQYPTLHMPAGLYLLHLKFCDFEQYVAAMDRRNAVVSDVGAPAREASIGKHWYAEARGTDRATFDAFAELPTDDTFDMAPLRDHMRATWGPRGDTGYYHFDRPEPCVQYLLPERFVGLV